MGLTATEKEVLIDLLVRSDNCAANIAEDIDRSRPHTSTCLSGLSEKGYVRSKGSGVYTLTFSGIRTAQELFQTGEFTVSEFSNEL